FRINVFLFAPLRCFIILFHLSGFCNSADFRGNRSEPFKPAVRTQHSLSGFPAGTQGAQQIHHRKEVGVWPPCFGRFLSVPAAATQKTLHGAGRACKSNQGVLHHVAELAGNAPLPIHGRRLRTAFLHAVSWFSRPWSVLVKLSG
ncbi:hypothetical protein, partial [Arthrobacter luteolus]|uniref:hypothetical protein n=1 Tax=Arthrobacter luteolus TaxID=98672 RepID=UPI001960B700